MASKRGNRGRQREPAKLGEKNDTGPTKLYRNEHEFPKSTIFNPDHSGITRCLLINIIQSNQLTRAQMGQKASHSQMTGDATAKDLKSTMGKTTMKEKVPDNNNRSQ